MISQNILYYCVEFSDVNRFGETSFNNQFSTNQLYGQTGFPQPVDSNFQLFSGQLVLKNQFKPVATGFKIKKLILLFRMR
jgi:hypothetical protein